MRLSIIVPVYKVEAFLDKCVESILAQTFADFELILVDDGSPDRSGEMCDLWAEKDPRIRVIHKENGGLSDARNAGIDAAKGDCIGLVDSDDYIKSDMFEVLMNNLEQTGADISMCGYADIYANAVRKDCEDRTVFVWSRKEAVFEILLGRKLSVHAVTKVYRRRLFEKARYPVGKVSEDAYIIMDLMDRVDKAVFTPYAGYYYVHRGESINTGNYIPKDLTRIEAHEKNYRYICETFPEYRKLAYERYLGAVSFVASKMAFSGVRESDPDCRSLYRTLRKNLFRIWGARYFSTKRKCSITLMVISKRLYTAVMKKRNVNF